MKRKFLTVLWIFILNAPLFASGFSSENAGLGIKMDDLLLLKAHYSQGVFRTLPLTLDLSLIAPINLSGITLRSELSAIHRVYHKWGFEYGASLSGGMKNALFGKSFFLSSDLFFAPGFYGKRMNWAFFFSWNPLLFVNFDYSTYGLSTLTARGIEDSFSSFFFPTHRFEIGMKSDIKTGESFFLSLQAGIFTTPDLDSSFYRNTAHAPFLYGGIFLNYIFGGQL